MAYDDANTALRREACFPVTTAGATTLSTPAFRSFQKTKVKAIHFFPIVVGSTAVHGYDIMINTASVAVCTVGTTTALVSATLNTSLASGDRVQIKSKTDATATVEWVVEHQLDPDAART